MTLTLKQESSGCWSIYAGAERLVDRESYAVASRILEAYESPGSLWPSEADEVAESIRRYLVEVA